VRVRVVVVRGKAYVLCNLVMVGILCLPAVQLHERGALVDQLISSQALLKTICSSL
jgi:hypothetical protein